MANPFFLSEGDRDALRALLTEWRQRHWSYGPNSHDAQDPLPDPNDVYVALTPDGGIPGFTLTRVVEVTGIVGTGTGTGTGITTTSETVSNLDPPSAECSIYQLLDATDGGVELSPIDTSPITVYNLNPQAIQSNTWILVIKDKFGTWWMVGSISSYWQEDTPATWTEDQNDWPPNATLFGTGPLIERVSASRPVVLSGITAPSDPDANFPLALWNVTGAAITLTQDDANSLEANRFILSYRATQQKIQETPSGTIDGSNLLFTLSETPITSEDVYLELNGLGQEQGIDYTVSGPDIAFLPGNAPQVGDTLVAIYDDPNGATTLAGDVTDGLAVVTGLSDTSTLSVGDLVYGAGVPENTYVLTIDGPDQVTLTNPIGFPGTGTGTGTGTGVTIPSGWFGLQELPVHSYSAPNANEDLVFVSMELVLEPQDWAFCLYDFTIRRWRVWQGGGGEAAGGGSDADQWLQDTASPWASTQNDWQPNAALFGTGPLIERIAAAGTGAIQLTGIVAPSDPNHNFPLLLWNVDSPTITIRNENGSSQASNRFHLQSSTDLALGQDDWAFCLYDFTLDRWRVSASSLGTIQVEGFGVDQSTGVGPLDCSTLDFRGMLGLDPNGLYLINGGSGHIYVGINAAGMLGGAPTTGVIVGDGQNLVGPFNIYQSHGTALRLYRTVPIFDTYNAVEFWAATLNGSGTDFATRTLQGKIIGLGQDEGTGTAASLGLEMVGNTLIFNAADLYTVVAWVGTINCTVSETHRTAFFEVDINGGSSGGISPSPITPATLQLTRGATNAGKVHMGVGLDLNYNPTLYTMDLYSVPGGSGGWYELNFFGAKGACWGNSSLVFQTSNAGIGAFLVTVNDPISDVAASQISFPYSQGTLDVSCALGGNTAYYSVNGTKGVYATGVGTTFKGGICTGSVPGPSGPMQYFGTDGYGTLGFWDLCGACNTTTTTTTSTTSTSTSSTTSTSTTTAGPCTPGGSDCCGGNLCADLCITITGTDAGCSCMSGQQFTITWSGAGSYGPGWYSSTFNCGGHLLQWFMSCGSNFITVQLYDTTPATFLGEYNGTIECSGYTATGSLSASGTTCSGTISFTIGPNACPTTTTTSTSSTSSTTSTSTTTSGPSPCSPCPTGGTPTAVTVGISGLTNTTGDSCGNLNGVWVLNEIDCGHWSLNPIVGGQNYQIEVQLISDGMGNCYWVVALFNLTTGHNLMQGMVACVGNDPCSGGTVSSWSLCNCDPGDCMTATASLLVTC